MSSTENKISILYVIDGLEFGGGERVFLQLASALRGRHKIFVATNIQGKFAQELTDQDIQTFPVDMTRQVTFKPILQIRDIIRQNQIDLVHSQGTRADFFARMAAKLAGAYCIICTVAMPVEGFEVGPVRKSIYRFIDRFTEPWVDRFLVVSESLKENLIDGRGISEERVARIYNGIELDQFRLDLENSGLKEQLEINPDAILIGAIGRLVWQKGFEYFIRAIPEVLQVDPNTTFLLVGDGPLRPHLESEARKLNLHDNLIFTGFRSDILELLSIIDILVIPSILEGFPMITLEAMAVGKPIVATNINGITEQILDSTEGILVPPKDPKALTTAILKLLHDKELSTRLGLAARTKVERCFSLDTMLSETEKVYLSLLNSQYLSI